MMGVSIVIIAYVCLLTSMAIITVRSKAELAELLSNEESKFVRQNCTVNFGNDGKWAIRKCRIAGKCSSFVGVQPAIPTTAFPSMV